jgi:hypothetical protein
LFVSAALLLAACVQPASPADAAEDCALKQVAAIPAHLASNGTLVMDAVINDTPATLTLSTASDYSYLSEDFAKRAGMPIDTLRGEFRSTGRRLLGQVTRIKSLQLGTARSSYEGFALTAGGPDGTDGSAVGGVGADYLSNYDVEIDLAGGKVNLWSQDHCPGQAVYWADTYFKVPVTFREVTKSRFRRKRPEIDIVADGKTLHAMIATDDANMVLREALAETRFGLAPDSPEMVKDGVWRDSDGKAFDRYAHTLGSLTFGDVTIHNTPVMIEPIDIAANEASTGSHLNVMNTEQPDFYLGMKPPQKFRLYIAYREAALYYTIAAPKP